MPTNPLRWEYLTQSPPVDNPLGPLAMAYLGLSAVGLLVAVFFATWGKRLFKGNPSLQRVVGLYATVGYSAFGIGLILLVLRVLEVPFLSMRLWTYLSAIVIVATGSFVLYFHLVRYPKIVEEQRQQEIKRRYLRPHNRAVPRGKKKRR